MRPTTQSIAAMVLALCGSLLLAQNSVEQRQDWDRTHPQLAFWRDSVQIPLSAPNHAALFERIFKDAGLPPQQILRVFTARIVSMTPAVNPSVIVVEMSDPADPNTVKAKLNAKLLLDPRCMERCPSGPSSISEGRSSPISPTSATHLRSRHAPKELEG